MSVNEEAFNNHQMVSKSPLTADNIASNPDPFLFAGSIVDNGFGTAMSCVVGDYTYIGKQGE